MNNSWEYLRSVVVVLAILVLASLIGAQLLPGQAVSVSIPNLQNTARERVVGFELHIMSGRIAAVPNVPIGWHISIDNDASWNTVIKASATVGAAALTRDFFRKFVVIERNTSLGAPFSVHGEVAVTKNFATERRIRIGMADLAMQ